MTFVDEKVTSQKCVDPSGGNKSLAAVINPGLHFLITATNYAELFI